MSPAASAGGLRLSRRQWLLSVLIFFVILLNYLDRQTLSVLAPVIRKELGLSLMDYAWAVNAFLLAYGIMYAGSGVLLDRWGYRTGMTISVAVWSAVCGLHAVTFGLASLTIFRFLLGMAEPGGWTGSIKTISEQFSAAQRGIATGILSAGGALGAVISPPLIVAINQRYGWRSAFLLACLAGFVWLPFWLYFTPKKSSSASVKTTRGPATRSLVADRRVQAYMACRFFGDSSGYFFMFWLPEYLVTSRHFTLLQFGTAGWIPFLASAAGSLAGGYASSLLIGANWDSLLARKFMMSLAPVMVAIGAAFQGFSATWMILLSISVSAFGVGVWAGNMHAIPGDAFPEAIVATVHGLAGTAGAVGGILFNTLVGHWSVTGNTFGIFVLLTAIQPLGASALWLGLPGGPNATLSPKLRPGAPIESRPT